MPEISALTGRFMYIWKLKPVLVTEMGIKNFVQKAKKAKLSGVWIKVAEGRNPYTNVLGEMESQFHEVIQRLNDKGIAVWGWHVPQAATADSAQEEAELVAWLAEQFNVSGVLMDAEAGGGFFKGNAETADTYARALRETLMGKGKGLAICSHDIPKNFPEFPFDAFAQHATVNAPQVYYGGSSSVENRLSRAIAANSHLDLPFVPVGAGWIGDGGGCSSASACAERAIIFMRLVRDQGFPGYSFWHWFGAPPNLWEVLFTEPV
jgi:hypothetical protein